MKTPKTIPPKLAGRFLRWFLREELAEEVEGDLTEQFRLTMEERSLFRARMNYWFQVFRYLRPFAVKKMFSLYPQQTSTGMYKNYFKVAFRNMNRHRFYSVLNVLGLAIGLTCSILIYLYVNNELSYDTFNKKADRIFRLVTNIVTPTETIKTGVTSGPMAPALKDEFPEVSEAVRIHDGRFLLQFNDKKFQEDNAIFADAGFFRVLDYKLVEGNRKEVLSEPFSVVMTESAAKKYFGNDDPVGKTVIIENQYDATVKGVMEDVPENSQLQFNMIVSMSTLVDKIFPHGYDDWGNFGFTTYLLLSKNTAPSSLEKKLTGFMEAHTRQETDMNSMNSMTYSLFLEPLTWVYLHSGRGGMVSGNIDNIYIFSVIALLILVIAGFNFMNLATARATERVKEVGIRKTIGAARSQLGIQFLIESVLISMGAMLLALLLSQSLLPMFNRLAGKEIAHNIFSSATLVTWSPAIALMIGLLSGFYPAIVISGFNPLAIFRGAVSRSDHGIMLRKIFVVSQFVLSMALVAGTLIIFSQMKFMRNRDLGFTKDQMLIVDFRRDPKVESMIETIKHDLLSDPSVTSVAASSSEPGRDHSGAYTKIENPSGEIQGTNVALYSVDYNFIKHYKIKIVAGRAFSTDFPSDSTHSLILNEAAVSSLGYKNTEDIIGKKFDQWGRKGRIIGVIGNFNYHSLEEAVQPLSLRPVPEDCRYLSLKINPGNINQTVSRIRERWNRLVPWRPFEYFFLDDNFNKQYNNEVRFGQLFTTFAGLAIFIACLGLLGLTTYSIVQRTKEIGIRKVLGATVGNILYLLSRHYIRLIAFAFAIAVPLTWYAMNLWLQHFAYRIQVQWWIFLVTGFSLVLISLMTMSLQTIKAALSDPVKSLRTE